jgi:23S rRNA pseudouridine2605 synthase
MKRKNFKPKDESNFKPKREGSFKSKKSLHGRPSESVKGKNSFDTDKKNRNYPKRKKGFVSKMKRSTPFKTGVSPALVLAKQEGEGLIRLNKYLSNAGICSRREADAFIATGVVKVNGEIITQLGYKISPGDKVQFGGDSVHKEKSMYILLNKPRGYITTCDDPQERDTVLDLIHGVKERVYPVGRLDRNTSGLLLLTNDGDLAKTLMHPRYNVAKIYNVVLDKPLTPDDLAKIRKGIGLEDGFIKVDAVEYVEGADSRNEIGIEIHSGKNRVIRRIFESLGYRVDKLDRVLYASLTKKNLPRGKWRFLEENEVRMLKRIK